jgi:hypothetical protein
MKWKFLWCAKVFGCPVYILNPGTQGGKKIPKWEPCSHRSQFLGFFTHHSSSVALVGNLHTESITPQYHLVTTQHFETILGGLSPTLFTNLDASGLGEFFKT